MSLFNFWSNKIWVSLSNHINQLPTTITSNGHEENKSSASNRETLNNTGSIAQNKLKKIMKWITKTVVMHPVRVPHSHFPRKRSGKTLLKYETVFLVTRSRGKHPLSTNELTTLTRHLSLSQKRIPAPKCSRIHNFIETCEKRSQLQKKYHKQRTIWGCSNEKPTLTCASNKRPRSRIAMNEQWLNQCT